MARQHRLRFAVTGLLYWVLVVVGCLLGENVDLFANAYDTKLSFDTIAVISILFLVILAIYLYSELRHNRPNMDFMVLGFVVLFFSLGISGIWRVEDTVIETAGSPVLVTFSDFERLGWTFIMVIGALLCYITLAIYPRRTGKTSFIMWVCYAFALVGLVSIVVSLATETSMYIGIFDGESDRIVIKSFFNNENTYGGILMLSILALGLVSIRWNKWFNYVGMLVLYIAMVFSTSVSSLVIAGGFLILFFVYQMISSFARHPFRNLSFIVIAIVLLITVGIGYSSLLNSGVETIINFNEFLTDYIFNKNVSTLSGRVTVWEQALSYLNSPTDLLFGLGYKSFNKLMMAWQSRGSASLTQSGAVDSSYVQLICSYGVLGLVAYIAFICYLFYIFVYLVAKKHWKVAFPTMIGLISILGYGVVETCVLFEPTIKGTVLSAMFVVPLLSEYNLAKHPKMVEEIKAYEPPKRSLSLTSALNSYKFLSAMLMSFVAVTLMSFIFVPVRDGTYTVAFTYILAMSLLMLVSLPYLSVLMVRGGLSRKKLVMRIIANAAAFLIVFIGSGVIALTLYGLAAAAVVTFIASFVVLGLQSASYLTAYGSLDEYLYYLGRHSLLPSIIPLVIFTVITTILNCLFAFPLVNYLHFMSVFALLWIEVAIFLVLLFLFPNAKGFQKEWMEVIYHYNDTMMLAIKGSYLKPRKLSWNERRKQKKAARLRAAA